MTVIDHDLCRLLGTGGSAILARDMETECYPRSFLAKKYISLKSFPKLLNALQMGDVLILEDVEARTKIIRFPNTAIFAPTLPLVNRLADDLLPEYHRSVVKSYGLVGVEVIFDANKV